MSLCDITCALQALVSDVDIMSRRVGRLQTMARCLEYSMRPDIGNEQTAQLNDMASQLDAMRHTCLDRMLLSDRNLPSSQRTVCNAC